MLKFDCEASLAQDAEYAVKPSTKDFSAMTGQGRARVWIDAFGNLVTFANWMALKGKRFRITVEELPPTPTKSAKKDR